MPRLLSRTGVTMFRSSHRDTIQSGVSKRLVMVSPRAETASFRTLSDELITTGTFPVHVLGSSLPRHLHPRLPLTIVFSILRSLLLTFLLACSFILPGPASPMNPLHGIEHFDVYIVDQQSVCVPLLRLLTGTRVVFYCHFPDKLLSGGWSFGADKVERTQGGLLKRMYRWPIDKLEEWTTGELSAPSPFRISADGSRTIRYHPIKLSVHVKGLLESLSIACQTTTQGRLPMYRHQPLSSPKGR